MERAEQGASVPPGGAAVRIARPTAAWAASLAFRPPAANTITRTPICWLPEKVQLQERGSGNRKKAKIFEVLVVQRTFCMLCKPERPSPIRLENCCASLFTAPLCRLHGAVMGSAVGDCASAGTATEVACGELCAVIARRCARQLERGAVDDAVERPSITTGVPPRSVSGSYPATLSKPVHVHVGVIGSLVPRP